MTRRRREETKLMTRSGNKIKKEGWSGRGPMSFRCWCVYVYVVIQKILDA